MGVHGNGDLAVAEREVGMMVHLISHVCNGCGEENSRRIAAELETFAQFAVLDGPTCYFAQRRFDLLGSQLHSFHGYHVSRTSWVKPEHVSAWLQPEPANWWPLVEDAFHEDIGSGDVTAGCLPPDLASEWYIEAQADGVVCGLGIVESLLTPYPGDPEEQFLETRASDGDRVRRGDKIVEGVLNTRRLLSSERTSLNFLMMLSGTATMTSQFVQRVEGTSARIIDTRKTVPLLRGLQKYAVRCGGGGNHRMGLFDAVMIKDNHIAACGGIGRAVDRVRSYLSHMIRIEVECTSLEQVDEAVRARADVILLDNMDPFMMREAVKKHEGKVLFEASGGITLETVRGVAQTGVDFISVGALTHSAPSLPFHLEVA